MRPLSRRGRETWEPLRGGGASLPPPLCPHLEGPVLQLQKRGWGPLLNEIGEIGMLTAWEILSIYFLSTEALFR